MSLQRSNRQKLDTGSRGQCQGEDRAAGGSTCEKGSEDGLEWGGRWMAESELAEG